jgi:UDP-N-acetyl-2-amino-2-deoxyglucuronate dehydrogenase
MSKPIGIALIGTGSIADFHVRALQMIDGAKLVAVHARNAERGQAFADQNGCLYIDDYEALLARDDIDAVAITTPSGTHSELGIKAARAGKHVFCEKPLDVTIDKIDALIQACDENGVKLGAVFQSRFGPGAQAFKRAVEAGRFGRLTQCSAYIPWFRSAEYYAGNSWRGTWALDGGGALMNQGVHAVDMLLWLVGEVSEVSARCQTRLHEGIEVEDNAVAWLQFQNGAVGVIQASTCCYPGEAKRVELKGEKGSVTLEDDRPIFWQFDEELPEDAEVRALAETAGIGGGASDPRAISVEGHRLQYQDFIDALQADREPAIPGREGRRSVALIRAIYESSESQNLVSLG